jgi:Fuc2NAc and GlcNAc transferase
MLGIVWLTNLYNFMDGIDGIAAVEAITVGLAGALLLAGREPSLALVALVVAGAAGGFLVWNWPPAKLFMGDVGSGFLGYIFGGLALASENVGALPALLWLVLLGPFFVDTTLTLLRRIARGERWWAAHRTHAYQRAVQAGWSHRRVTTLVAALSAALGMAGALAAREPSMLGPVLAGAFSILVAIYLLVERSCRMPSPRDHDGLRNESL